MKRQVLVVDDDPGTRRLVAEVVREFGAEVHEASTDAEGYARFLEVGPDLILIDLLLPRKGGMHLLRRIRGVRGGRDVPVLMMSAVYRGTDIRAEAVEELGAVDFLRKPFHLPTLRDRVRSVLGARRPGGGVVSEPFTGQGPVSRGSLAAVELPAVLRDLERRGATGCLHLRQGRVHKVLYLRAGQVVFVSSNRLSETLGRYLLSRGVIDEEAYAQGLEAMRSRGTRMGEFLVERGLVDPEALHGALRQHLWEKTLEVFGWTAGEFRVSGFQPPPAELPGPAFEIPRLVWEGVHARYPYDRITSALGPYEGMPLGLRGDLFELASRVPLEREDLLFLHLVRRRQGEPLGRVLAEAQSESEVRTLYYLLVYGYLGLVDHTPAPGEMGGVDFADLERVRKARRELEFLRSRNYFQVLGAQVDADDEAVRQAYLHRAKDVHPDVLGPNDPPAIRRIYEEMFRLVQNAYEALKTEARRREYLRFLEGGEEEEVIRDARNVLEAEALFQHGRLLLRRRQWDAAAECFEEALRLHPDEGEYVLYLGIARVRQAAAGRPRAVEEAESLFRRAADMLPGSPEPWYRLGRIHAVRGDEAEAHRMFREAVRRDPNHTEAQRELRLLASRMEKRSGGLGGLFRRKGGR